MHDERVRVQSQVRSPVATPDADVMEMIADGVRDALLILPRWEIESVERQRLLADALEGLGGLIRQVAHQRWVAELRTLHEAGTG